MLQQPFLAPETAIVAGEPAVFSNHAMAWNYDGDGIFPVGIANCPAGLNITYVSRYLLIGAGFSIGNFTKSSPNLLSELRPLGSKV